MLHEQLKSELKDTMKAKDLSRLGVIRGILAEITNELVSQGRKPQDTLEDAEVIKTIKRLAKQRRDSIEQYTSGNRPELAAEEEEELSILETYLPATMEKGEVVPIAKAKQKELGITDEKDKGRLIGEVMRELGDQVDGMIVKEVVDELFSGNSS